MRKYLSLILLFIPAVVFVVLLFVFRDHESLDLNSEPFLLPLHFWLMGLFGMVATVGGVLDWRLHRYSLNMKMSKKERDAEAAALGLGGVPMFVLMFLAMMSETPHWYLIPILVVLIYTVVAICYDEFIFHIKRCGPEETVYHRMLVFGNGLTWLVWMHYIFCR